MHDAQLGLIGKRVVNFFRYMLVTCIVMFVIDVLMCLTKRIEVAEKIMLVDRLFCYRHKPNAAAKTTYRASAEK